MCRAPPGVSASDSVVLPRLATALTRVAPFGSPPGRRIADGFPPYTINRCGCATGVCSETVATLTFTILPELDYAKTVEDGNEQNEVESFRRGDAPYSGEWIEVDDGRLIRRDAIVSVHIAELGEVTFGLGVIE